MGVKLPASGGAAAVAAVRGTKRPGRSTRRSPGRPRMGSRLPQYVLALNPYPAQRFTSCPRCAVATRVRKVPLVIHVEGAGLLVLRKSCRLCPACELLVVHQKELEALIPAACPSAAAPGRRLEYLVLGTIDGHLWRQGRARGGTIDELTAHMVDFRGEAALEVILGGWHPRGAGR